MGQLTMIPIYGSSKIKQLCGLGWGNKQLFFILSLGAFVKKYALMEMPRLTILQPEPLSPCCAMAEGGLATAQIA